MDKYTGKKHLTHNEIKTFIKENNIESIRVGFTDILGIQRGKLLPIGNIESLLDAEGDGLSCSSAVFALGFDDEFVDVSFLPDKRDDISLMADLSTIELLPYAPQTAFVQADLVYNREPFEASPRGFLKNVVDEYHKIGIEPMCVCELEFFAFKRDAQGKLNPYTDANCNCYTTSSRNDPSGLIERIADSLSEMDYHYLGWNHEFFCGQYEFNWGHAPAVKAADHGVLFKIMCKDLAFETGTEVTFMASPMDAGGASGCHFHISLTDMKTKENLFFDPQGNGQLSDLTRNFAGGMLEHAKAITPFLAPTVNCYKRYQPDSYAPTHIAWGDDNRTTYLRVPKARGQGTRLEARAASAACNPYLALAALLLAGMDGIKQKTTPPPMTNVNIYRDSHAKDDFVTLPTRLAEAIDYTRKDQWINNEFPKPIMELFLALKEREFLNFERTVTNWERDTYFKQM